MCLGQMHYKILCLIFTVNDLTHQYLSIIIQCTLKTFIGRWTARNVSKESQLMLQGGTHSSGILKIKRKH